jgi:hypothetical protein
VKSRIIETNGTRVELHCTNGLSSDEVVVIEELPNLKMMWKSSLRQ